MLCLQGFGSESETNYPNSELVFLNIHNIHVMRDRSEIWISDVWSSCNQLSIPMYVHVVLTI